MTASDLRSFPGQYAVAVSDRRLLLVHAHPDDESSQSPATMSHYLAEGAQVTLVTCTLGELGEILVDDWSHYSPAELGQHRIAELAEALKILGVTDHVFLGGPGCYHDSGMERGDDGRAIPPAELPDGAFWHADLLEASNHLVQVIRDRKPQVVSTYDPFGNYGHPDHVMAHRVAMYACQLAAVPSHRPDLGEPWQVERILWGTHNTAVWKEGAKIAAERGLQLFGDVDPADEDAASRFGPDPAQIVAVVDYGEYEERCVAALRAHRSQVDPDNEFWQFFEIIRGLPGSGEAYLYAGGKPFPPSDGPATDIFAGLD